MPDSSDPIGNAPATDVDEEARVRARVFAALVGDDEASAPAKIGRFVLLDRLGAGAMGVVWAAYDPDLDRRVALKLLRDEREDVRARLVREAQAMAKLSHPNIAAVYEVGTHAGRVYLAMELVEGATLRQWIAAAPRRWQEVLSTYRQAGSGLAAAHAAGLVHRDFKPDNAIVGGDGRVRVLDFGLARRDVDDDSAQLTTLESTGETRERDALATPLTRTGALLGTPAYMALEQLQGRTADARSDQFAFCVALWEALFGERPFSGSSAVELATNVGTGRIRDLPRGSGVPRYVADVLRRGLQVAPADRHASMDVLLTALARGRRRAAIRTAAVASGVVGLAAAGIAAADGIAESRRVAECERTGASITEVWNDVRRDELHAALLATGVGYAEATAERLMPWFDERARAWRTARTDACLDARVSERWDTDTLDRSTWCLDERRAELVSLIDELSVGEVPALDKAVTAAANLPPVEPCRDPDVLARQSIPAAAQREEVAAVRAELARAAALAATGAYARGDEVARAALERAERIEWAPLIAAARLRMGELAREQGSYADAEPMLELAYFAGANAGSIDLAATAAEQLVVVVGFRLARPEDGLRWSHHAEVIGAGVPDPTELLAARHARGLGYVHAAKGEYNAARGFFESSLAIRERELGRDHPRVADELNDVAWTHWKQGSYLEAKRFYERALELNERALGPDHPSVAALLNSLAWAQYTLGNYDDARALRQRVLEISVRSYGPDNQRVADALNSIASSHLLIGEYEQASAAAQRAVAIMEAAAPDHPDFAAVLSTLANAKEGMGAHAEAKTLRIRALAIREKALPPGHLDLSVSLDNLASSYQTLGEYDEAAALLRRALAILETHHGRGIDQPDVARVLNNLGNARRSSGANDEARELYERSLAMGEATLGKEHPFLAHPLLGAAEVALAQGRTADAVALAERASALRERTAAAPAELAAARFVLARGLIAGDRASRARAITAAREARDVYRGLGDVARDELATADRWLAKHDASP